jgi:hypothetical protein
MGYSNNLITAGENRFGVSFEYDKNTFETCVSATPYQFGDEFVGAGHGAGVPAAGSPAVGYPWVKKIVGSAPPTVGILPNTLSGVMQCALASTSEAEEASLYFNDSLSVGTTGTTIGLAEWRTLLAVAPTGVAQVFLGMGSVWVGGPLNLARYMGFLWNSSAGLYVVSQDGNGHSYSIAAAQIGGSAITTDTAAYHVYRIDWSNPSDVTFFVDGNRVNAVGSVIWNPSSTANGILQPLSTVYKASGTGLATLNIDKIDIFTNR